VREILHTHPYQQMILSAQQQQVIEELTPIARIATDGSREPLKKVILPRCSSLIVGPSGSGKTYLAKHIAKSLGLPCLHINVSTWVLIASKSEPWTWTTIAEWLATLNGGGIIILDEIDKLGGGNNGAGSEYGSFLRLEIFSLMDGSIPPAIKLQDITLMPDHPAFLESDALRQHIENTLQSRVMVIGCGAWQNEWQSNSKTLGFTTEQKTPKAEPPSRDQILNSIQPELRQRFRNEISFLHPMGQAEYEAVAEAICRQIPAAYRREWLGQVGEAIQVARDTNLGMRVFEELILRVMIMTGPEHVPSWPQPRKGSLNLI
jgi:SpoVK/Ycf46/Vps4 family AAA+-type ATPase